MNRVWAVWRCVAAASWWPWAWASAARSKVGASRLKPALDRREGFQGLLEMARCFRQGVSALGNAAENPLGQADPVPKLAVSAECETLTCYLTGLVELPVQEQRLAQP